MVFIFKTSFIAIAGIKVQKGKNQLIANTKRFVKKLEAISDDEAQEVLEEKSYVAVLGVCGEGTWGTGNVSHVLLWEILFVSKSCIVFMKLLLWAG